MIEIGSYIGDRYEVIEKIGAGGMSDVFKAKDQVLGRFVAIKVLKQEFAEDVNFVSKFHAEAQSAALLQHANIVNIYDVGAEDHVHFIVMEYVEGITLKTYIEKKGTLNYKEAISIAIQVGRGIEAAHNAKIVHRDIKPQNIMISNEGKVKVMDFGIARAATSNTIHSDVMGSVHYSSPEQARNGFVDCKSDIYSLGIVMYEMVTGRVPFDGDTTVAIAIQHLQDEMVPPSTYAPDLPISLEKIIIKCTQKSQDRRYPTMGELLNDLKHALMRPDEDFVVIETAVSQGKTTVIGQEELESIRRNAVNIMEPSNDGLGDYGTNTGTISSYDAYQNQASQGGVDIDPDWSNTSVVRKKNQRDEEESDGFLNPKMEKVVTILGIVAAVIIIAVVIVLLVNTIPSCSGPGTDDLVHVTVNGEDTDEDTKKPDENTVVNPGNGEPVAMIDIRGKSVDDAKVAIEQMGLMIFSDGNISSEEFPAGTICYQSVEPDVMVTPGTVINIKVSSGTGQIDIPYVVGNIDTAAIKMIEDLGLICKREYQYSDNVAKDVVISQNPDSGNKAVKGDTITIVVSQGKEAATVPNIVGKTEEEAKNAITEAKLQVGLIRSEYSDTVAKGVVISQDIAAGGSTTVGATMDFTVSLGKEVKKYRFSANITLPNDDSVKGADIYLYDSNGQVVEVWDGIYTSDFPLTIEADDIDASSGRLVIEWVLEDSDGNQTTSIQESSVTFREM